jgi:predicted nuclease of predicted toxin-antitoxin system
MKFLIDAHLPRRLKYRLQERGFDTIHTLDLPLKNRTPDSVLEEISISEIG